TTERGGARGFDAHKRVKGRKRHILVDTLGLLVANRVEPADTSDRRAGAFLLGGLSALFPRIRTVIADAGHESRKLARTLKQNQGWQLRIVKRRQRTFKITGLTWIVERSFAWMGRNRRLKQGLRVSGPNLRNDDRPCRNPPYAQPNRPCMRLFKHPLKVRGQWVYLYRAVDKEGNTVESYLESHARRHRRQSVPPSRRSACDYPGRLRTNP